MATRDRQQIVGSLLGLNAKATTGAGTAFALGGAYNSFAVQHEVSTGGSTAATLALQGSIDGTNYVTLGSAITATTANALTRSTSAIPVTHVRLSITSFTTLASTAADNAAVTARIAVI